MNPPFLKAAIVILALFPLGGLAWQGYSGTFSANPIDDITDATGIWTLRLLLVTLSITPLVSITGWSKLGQLRRMLGVFSFVYAALHFTTYIWLDKFFDIGDAISDVINRPFIAAGFAALLILLPLAATSTNAMTKRLGGKRWKRLHRLTYIAAVAGAVHYLWLVKADLSRPLIYGGILALLLGYRLWLAVRRRKDISPGHSA